MLSTIDDLAVAVDDDEVAVLVLDRGDVDRNRTVPGFLASCLDCSVTREAVPPKWNVRIVSWVPGSPIDCAAMTPHGFADLDHLARRQHAAVAEAADAALGLAGENRADLDLLDARLLDAGGEVLGDLFVLIPMIRSLGERIVDVFLRRRGRRCGRGAARACRRLP